MSVKEKLIEARNLIEKKGWGQGHYAVDDDGVTVGIDSPDACRFCTMGAIYAANRTYSESVVQDLVQALGFDNSGEVLLWNDSPSRTKDQVLARFDRAIKELPA